jgi:hypothetical protein
MAGQAPQCSYLSMVMGGLQGLTGGLEALGLGAAERRRMGVGPFRTIRSIDVVVWVAGRRCSSSFSLLPLFLPPSSEFGGGARGKPQLGLD